MTDITKAQPPEGSTSDESILERFGISLSQFGVPIDSATGRGGIIQPNTQYNFRAIFHAGDCDLEGLTQHAESVAADLVARTLECVVRDDCCNFVASSLQRVFNEYRRGIDKVVVEIPDRSDDANVLRRETFHVRPIAHRLEHRYDSGQPLRHTLVFSIVDFSICDLS